LSLPSRFVAFPATGFHRAVASTAVTVADGDTHNGSADNVAASYTNADEETDTTPDNGAADVAAHSAANEAADDAPDDTAITAA
jgi:hypothetical protein